jgi:hypothetical protein
LVQYDDPGSANTTVRLPVTCKYTNLKILVHRFFVDGHAEKNRGCPDVGRPAVRASHVAGVAIRHRQFQFYLDFALQQLGSRGVVLLPYPLAFPGPEG